MKGDESKDIFQALMALLVMCAESAGENLIGAVRRAKVAGLEAEGGGQKQGKRWREETGYCGSE